MIKNEDLECLIGENIYLRPIQLKDTETIIQLRNSLDVRKNFIFQEDFTKNGHEKWLNENVFAGKAVQFMIHLREGNVVGSVYLRDIDAVNKKAEFGIFIGNTIFRGRGVGTEAAMLITEFGFEKLKLEKIFLRVFVENIGAIKSYVKAGFIQEGIFKNDVYINGKPRDIMFMAKFKINQGV